MDSVSPRDEIETEERDVSFRGECEGKEEAAVKKQDVVEVVELSDPFYASAYPPFLEMIKDFSEHISIPTIKYESLHNYICSVVQGVYDQKLRGVPDKVITYKCHVGLVNGKLAGFSMFYLLLNRLPHIQTIDWAYCHTKSITHPGKGDIRVAYKFAMELKKWKKLWGARYVSLVAADEGLNRVMKRLFKRPKACGTYWVAEDIRESLLKS